MQPRTAPTLATRFVRRGGSAGQHHRRSRAHRLISRFAAHTGVPVILNTSFNLRGEPIVHRPAEAVADFLNSQIDALFLGNLLATKT